MMLTPDKQGQRCGVRLRRFDHAALDVQQIKQVIECPIRFFVREDSSYLGDKVNRLNHLDGPIADARQEA